MKASIIVPFYNEEKRMKPFLDELVKYDNKEWEFILVNDGSRDKTLEILKKYRFRHKKIISYKKNRGKGYAVKTGVMAAKGNCIIFINADGSIHPSQIHGMIDHLKNYSVVVGTRKSKESRVKVPFIRQFTGVTFNLYANLIFNIDINDNLCGFKGFKKKVAKDLFKSLIDERWIFDVEIFYKTRKKNYSLYAMPIKWVHKDQSKMTPFDILKIAVTMLMLRIKLMGKKF